VRCIKFSPVNPLLCDEYVCVCVCGRVCVCVCVCVRVKKFLHIRKTQKY